MQLYINGQQADATLENEKTIGDVLASFEKTCEENDAAVTGIQVNGKNITAETFDETAMLPLESDSIISFEVVTKQTVQESLKFYGEKFTLLAEQMENVPVQLQTGKDNEANVSIAQLADTIDQFCHIASLTSLFPETIASIQIEGKNLLDFFSDFPNVLAELEQALESGDTVLMGDLAEYEICPRLRSLSKAIGETT